MANKNQNDVIVSSTEFIPDRLYFVVLKTHIKPKYTQNSHYFSIDDELIYDPFFEDFGPLNLALLYRYCNKLNRKLKAYSFISKKIVHYTTLTPHKRVNAAYLVGSYAVIYLKMNPDEVYSLLNKGSAPIFPDFRDASNGFAIYKISLLDCLKAIYQAHKYNFFDFSDFNLEEYEFYESVENGDLNWIVPNKFLAFAGPKSKPHLSERSVIGYPTHTPESYVKYFRENNVKTIVRLNKKLYDASEFTKEGFVHKDLFFFDGSTPNDDLVQKFLSLSESTTGAVAVHCKAGLGRTGSMIACYIMKWYHFSAREAIAWLRICRPASIIGYQQKWLEMKESEMWNLHSNLIPPKHKFGIYSIKAKFEIKGKARLNVKSSKATTGQITIDNVSRIANKVDSMSIDNQSKNENEVNENLSNKESVVADKFSLQNNTFTQGDKLNQIKASRLNQNRTHPPRSLRTSWTVGAINGTKRTINSGKLHATHPRRPLTRSKSNQVPPMKSILSEGGRPCAGSASAVGVTVPLPLGMTLRSGNRMYSLRHMRTPETRVCKTTSVRLQRRQTCDENISSFNQPITLGEKQGSLGKGSKATRRQAKASASDSVSKLNESSKCNFTQPTLMRTRSRSHAQLDSITNNPGASPCNKNLKVSIERLSSKRDFWKKCKKPYSCLDNPTNRIGTV